MFAIVVSKRTAVYEGDSVKPILLCVVLLQLERSEIDIDNNEQKCIGDPSNR